MRSETSDRVPARNCCSRCPIFLFCFYGPSCYHPQTGFPTAAFSRRRSAALLQMSEQIVKHFSCADLSPYVSLAFLPNVILALTENPSSKCAPLLFGHASLNNRGANQSHTTIKTTCGRACLPQVGSFYNLLAYSTLFTSFGKMQLCIIGWGIVVGRE